MPRIMQSCTFDPASPASANTRAHGDKFPWGRRWTFKRPMNLTYS